MSPFASVMDSVSRQIKSFKQTPLEKKVSEATSNDNWGTANSNLIELARETHEFNNFSTIMKGIWEAIGDKKEKWRRIYKALVLLEYCLKYGSERACSEARSEVYKLRPLADFKHMEEGRDKGAGIREKSKQLVELLSDHEALKRERLKATESKEKYSGISSGGATATPTGYVSTVVPAVSMDKKVSSSMSNENTTSKLDEYREKERKRKEEEQAKVVSKSGIQQPVISNSGKVVINKSGLNNSKKLISSSSSSGSSSCSSENDSQRIKTTDNLIDFDAPVIVPVVKPAGYPNIKSPQTGQHQTSIIRQEPNAYGTNPYGQTPVNPYGVQQSYQTSSYTQQAVQPIGTNPYGQQPLGQQSIGTNPYGQMNFLPYNGHQSYGQQAIGTNPYGQMNSMPYGQQPLSQRAIGTNPYGQSMAPASQTGSNPFAPFNGL